MSSFSEQAPLNPNDPEFYAPPRLRERAAKLGLSLSQEARLEPIRSSSISLPASLDVQESGVRCLVEPRPRGDQPTCWARVGSANRAARRCRCDRRRRDGCSAALRHHEACSTAIGRRFNLFRNNGIDAHRSASIRPGRRRIEARAGRVSSVPLIGPA